LLKLVIEILAPRFTFALFETAGGGAALGVDFRPIAGIGDDFELREQGCADLLGQKLVLLIPTVSDDLT